MNKNEFPEENKTRDVKTYLTVDEYEFISEKARDAGTKTISAYIRSKLFTIKPKLKYEKSFMNPKLMKLLGDIGHMQNNLNQIAGHLKEKNPEDPLIGEIEYCNQELYLYKERITKKAGEYHGSSEA